MYATRKGAGVPATAWLSTGPRDHSLVRWTGTQRQHPYLGQQRPGSGVNPPRGKRHGPYGGEVARTGRWFHVVTLAAGYTLHLHRRRSHESQRRHLLIVPEHPDTVLPDTGLRLQTTDRQSESLRRLGSDITECIQLPDAKAFEAALTKCWVHYSHLSSTGTAAQAGGSSGPGSASSWLHTPPALCSSGDG